MSRIFEFKRLGGCVAFLAYTPTARPYVIDGTTYFYNHRETMAVVYAATLGLDGIE